MLVAATDVFESFANKWKIDNDVNCRKLKCICMHKNPS